MKRPAVRHNPAVPTSIAVVGDRDPSYLTHRELDAALALMPAGVEARWVATDGPEASRLDRYDALWVVPGMPYRDEQPVFAGIERARTEGIPILGTCGGSSTWWSSSRATPRASRTRRMRRPRRTRASTPCRRWRAASWARCGR